ncbi:cupin domain-containing protein [Streptosporangium sp. NPDC006930]|uniref:cupin domain-containing protein n=1 Tax=unclassified Streptosporangium TaxID=2632669 RepID=UPI00344743B9
MNDEPVLLRTALAGFDQLWSPRIVTRVNDYDVRIAKVSGEHIWHVHENTDEFFMVLDGELSIALRDGDVDADIAVDTGTAAEADISDAGTGRGERVVTLPQGAVFVVPRGVEHRPSSAEGASILMFEPTGTPSVGDRHDPIPGHVDATIGHPLG